MGEIVNAFAKRMQKAKAAAKIDPNRRRPKRRRRGSVAGILTYTQVAEMSGAPVKQTKRMLFHYLRRNGFHYVKDLDLAFIGEFVYWFKNLLKEHPQKTDSFSDGLSDDLICP